MQESAEAIPGRGRGRAPDPQRVAQTREAILRSALTTFLERGFEGTRMVDVAARAGLAKGTLYLHFADKEVLFEFVLQQLISEPLARLRVGTAPPGESVRARLDRVMLPLLSDFRDIRPGERAAADHRRGRALPGAGRDCIAVSSSRR